MKIRIGTRKSRLALVQTTMVKEKIREAFPEAQVELVEMSTRGDELLDRSLTSFGGKGVFTRELEEALLKGEIDLAVHSAKDMPMEFPEGLGIGAVLAREDARDVFVTVTGTPLGELPPGSVVGTSSLRRELQVKELNPLVKIRMLRGNVQTRIRKLQEGQYDGILLAAAGLSRLGVVSGKEPETGMGTRHLESADGLHFQYLDPDELLPAAGQGILAVEAREGHLEDVLRRIHCPEAERLLLAERSFLAAIGGSCNAPAAGYCEETEDGLSMRVFFALDGKNGTRKEGFFPANKETALAEIRDFGERMAREVKKGKVYLVGAGPGDTGLMSKRGLELVQRADVLVYDNLISPSLLNEAREDAEFIYAGKRSSNHHLRQEETNALLVEKALLGKCVVRLKGGDPFIFGRGGEEAQELLKAGISYEVVPGISSCYAAAAYAGIPVTHRDYASSFHVITGHESNTKEGLALNYATLAREEGTLIFLMGLQNLPGIVAQLLEHGKSPSTPAAVIQWGTTCRQRCVTGTLKDIWRIVQEAGIKTPAITLVGSVASLEEELKWRRPLPLSGARVLLTGTKPMCEKQAEVLKEAGAEPVSFSLIRTQGLKGEELKAACENIKDYAWAVFTSANGVELFFAYLKEQGMDVRHLAGLRFAVIGEGTKAALERQGIFPDFVPEKYSSADLAAEWIPTLEKGSRVLLLRAREASRELTDALLEAGISYNAVALYKTAVDARRGEELNRILTDMDYVTFASASAVKAFKGMLMEGTSLPRVICIGPVTKRAAVKAGIPVHASGVEYTAEGMRDVILKDWRERNG